MALAMLLWLVSCKKESLSWNSDNILPLANTQLSIENLLPDSLISVSGNRVRLVNSHLLHSVSATSLITLKDTQVIKSVKLTQINLGDRRITRSITLGEVAKSAGGPLGLLIFLNGTNQKIPPIDNINTGTIPIDGTGLFRTASFSGGYLVLKINNGFPIPIADMTFNLENAYSKDLILSDVISQIPAGASVTRKYPVAGKKVEGNMVANITSLSSPGSGGNTVLIDTSDALRIELFGEDLKITEAEAIFPAQNVIDEVSNVEYDLGDAELTMVKIKAGQIKITAFNNLQDSLKVTYSVPGATNGSNGIGFYKALAPAVKGVPTTFTQSFDLSGYTVKLTGSSGKYVNTFTNILQARIDSTGELRNLSLKDSIRIDYGLYGIQPEYAKGYLGKSTVKIGPDKVPLDIFGRIKSGSVKLSDIDVRIEIRNTVGIDGLVRINRITGRNTNTGKQLELSGSALSHDLYIGAASDNPLTANISTLSLNKSNSNILELLEILPNELEYEFTATLNPRGNTNNYRDFIYSHSTIEARMNIGVPLVLNSDEIVLSDTLELGTVNSEMVSSVNSARFNLLSENGFPLEATLQIHPLKKENGNWKKMDPLLDTLFNKIEAGVVSGNPARVSRSTQSRIISRDLNQETLKSALQSKKMLFTAIIRTRPQGELLEIFSDYKIKVQLNAEVDKKMSF